MFRYCISYVYSFVFLCVVSSNEALKLLKLSLSLSLILRCLLQSFDGLVLDVSSNIIDTLAIHSTDKWSE